MPFDISGLNTVLDLVNSETRNERRLKLNQYSVQLKNLLLGTGIDVSESESQIIGLKVKPESKMMLLKQTLDEEGVFGAPFCTPATAKKRLVLRFSLHSELQADELMHVALSCKKAFVKHNI